MIKKISTIVEKACKKDSNYFGYGIWKYHIMPCVKYGKIMAKKLNANAEIVEIATLLHDYASIIDYKLYDEHHIHSANKGEKILLKFNYPKEKIELVKDCIFYHRGSIIKTKKSKEALCVADADAMAHFDSIASMFYLAFFSHKLNIDEANKWLLSKLERSWNKLSKQGKEIISDKYDACKLLLRC